ncbi:putative 4-hydroxybenzoate polyprenyl transferase [Xylariaceae sp. FL0016]|nr:putative 4-hydroxybenzoate polyprenyl transferase [Xylariaceae sp. FL0016]
MLSKKASGGHPQVNGAHINGKLDYFPELPRYTDPQTGFLSYLPRSWVPYAQLMRLDKPAGLYSYYICYLVSLLYAAAAAPEPPAPLVLLKILVALVPSLLLMRGAAVTWNDTIDQRFDRRVERTRHRPLARGAVSTPQALAFHLFLLALLHHYHHALDILPPAIRPHTLANVALAHVYPFTKRVTDFPQVYMGAVCCDGVFFAAAALGVPGEMYRANVALFGALTLWVVINDVVYAHQDAEDDAKIGVGSMAVRFRHSAKRLAGVLAVLHVTLLGVCGWWAGFGPVYFLGTVGTAGAFMFYYIYDVDLGSPAACGAWFYKQCWLGGSAVLAGFLGEYILKLG